MFYRTLLLAAVALTGAVNAQSRNETGTGPEIDPNSVPIAERQGWCRTQTRSCPQICGGRTQAGSNTCDATTLTYSCICENGISPNVSDYQQTLPGFVCVRAQDQCVAAHPDDLDGQTACRATTCGNKTDFESDTTASSSSASASETASSTSSSGSDASETASSTSDSSDDSASATSDSSSASETADADSAASALNLASNYGTGLLAAGILAAFGLAL